MSLIKSRFAFRYGQVQLSLPRMCTFTCNSHDGSGHTVLGVRAVFLVCCVLIPRPFCWFTVSSNFTQGVCSTIIVLEERSPGVSNPVCL